MVRRPYRASIGAEMTSLYPFSSAFMMSWYNWHTSALVQIEPMKALLEWYRTAPWGIPRFCCPSSHFSAKGSVDAVHPLNAVACEGLWNNSLDIWNTSTVDDTDWRWKHPPPMPRCGTPRHCKKQKKKLIYIPRALTVLARNAIDTTIEKSNLIFSIIFSITVLSTCVCKTEGTEIYSHDIIPYFFLKKLWSMIQFITVR